MRNPGMQKNAQKEASSAVTVQPTNGGASIQHGTVSASKVKKPASNAPVPTAAIQKKTKPQTPSLAALTVNTLATPQQAIPSVASL